MELPPEKLEVLVAGIGDHEKPKHRSEVFVHVIGTYQSAVFQVCECVTLCTFRAVIFLFCEGHKGWR